MEIHSIKDRKVIIVHFQLVGGRGTPVPTGDEYWPFSRAIFMQIEKIPFSTICCKLYRRRKICCKLYRRRKWRPNSIARPCLESVSAAEHNFVFPGPWRLGGGPGRYEWRRSEAIRPLPRPGRAALLRAGRVFPPWRVRVPAQLRLPRSGATPEDRCWGERSMNANLICRKCVKCPCGDVMLVELDLSLIQSKTLLWVSTTCQMFPAKFFRFGAVLFLAFFSEANSEYF